jgi:hypothetical protein
MMKTESSAARQAERLYVVCKNEDGMKIPSVALHVSWQGSMTLKRLSGSISLLMK